MTRRTLFLTTTAVAASAALFASGCGSNDNSDDNSGSSRDATAANTTKATASAPYGTYVRQLTKADVERTQKLRDQAGIEDGPNMSAPKPGETRLIIAKGARGDVVKTHGDTGSPAIDMDVYFDGEAMQATNYVDPGVGAFCGPAVSVPATYTVTADGDSLTLKPKTPDACPDRDASWTGTWQKR